MKTLNINSTVRIKLTSFGIERLKKNHEELCKNYPSIMGKFNPSEVDGDGFIQMQLWEVMHTFGDLLFDGSLNIPFEMNIQIDDADLEETEE